MIQPDRLWPKPWTRMTGVSRVASPDCSAGRTAASTMPSGYHHAQRAEFTASCAIPTNVPGRRTAAEIIPTRRVFSFDDMAARPWTGSSVKWLERARFVMARDLTLGDLFERLVAVHGSRALVEEPEPQPDGGRLTYEQAADLVANWAGGLHATIAAGDRVVVALPNSYRFLLACLAVVRAGG